MLQIATSLFLFEIINFYIFFIFRLIGINPILVVWHMVQKCLLRSSQASSGSTTQTTIRNSYSRPNSLKSWPSPHLVITIWFFSALFSLPHAFVNKVVIYPTVFVSITRCSATNLPEVYKQWLTLFTLFGQYLIPIGLTAMFYARIGHFLWRRTDPVGVVSEGRRLSLLRRKRKRVKMLVVVVTVFASCWFPLHLYVFLIEFGIIQMHFGTWLFMLIIKVLAY